MTDWEERFWSYVGRGGKDECWEWSGAPTGGGYGRMSVEDRDRYAHRLSFELHHGDPGDDFVLHHCDNRLCVNPDHLYAGDQQDNVDDAIERGRWDLVGEKNPQSKLTREGAEEVRRRARAGQERQSTIAEDFGVSRSLVSRIKTGKRWA